MAFAEGRQIPLGARRITLMALRRSGYGRPRETRCGSLSIGCPSCWARAGVRCASEDGRPHLQRVARALVRLLEPRPGPASSSKAKAVALEGRRGSPTALLVSSESVRRACMTMGVVLCEPTRFAPYAAARRVRGERGRLPGPQAARRAGASGGPLGRRLPHRLQPDRRHPALTAGDVFAGSTAPPTHP